MVSAFVFASHTRNDIFFPIFFHTQKKKLLFLFLFFTEFLGIFPEFGLIPRQKWRAAVRTNGEQIFFYWISIKVCFRSPFSFASVLAKFFLIFFVFFLLLGRRNVFGWPHQKLPSFSVFFFVKISLNLIFFKKKTWLDFDEDSSRFSPDSVSDSF